MRRIYFDTNIFSQLESNQEDKFQRLNEEIKRYKPNLSFFFSNAHIRDKRKADRKIEYYKFMEQFVEDNYICDHALKKYTTFYLATPLTVYSDDTPDPSISSVFDDADDDDELVRTFKSLNRTLLHTCYMPQADSNQLDNLPESQLNVLRKFLPSDNDMTMFDFMQNFSSITNELLRDQSTYKELRNYLDSTLNDGQYKSSDGSIDFNIAFQNSIFKKSFIEYVKDSLHFEDKDKIPYYDFFIQSYSLLDMLGISKEKLKSQNTYGNILNDALHSYYAIFCDYLVTEDKGLTAKSKVLYNMYGINTKVLSVEEFLNVLPTEGKNTEETVEEFFDKIIWELENGDKTISEVLESGCISEIKTKTKFINFFDKILQIDSTSGETYLLIIKDGTHPLSGPNYREKSGIVNKCINMFGEDLYKKNYFEFESEVKQSREGTWEGRIWKMGDSFLYLHNNQTLDQLCLQLGPYHNNINHSI